ncbi:hypothetical protein N7526_010950 [Penicillium atrosanguineum]|nr:hypothetical protein N7526_010950 [Penicillium atrosanguineum]
MATSKFVIATGTSSGLGFETIKQLLQQQVPYHFILGVRDTKSTKAAYNDLKFDMYSTLHSKRCPNLLATNWTTYFLNAGMLDDASGLGPNGSEWCEGYVVNHLAQHYLVHLLRDTLADSKSRLVIVSSGAIRGLRGQDPATLDVDLKANSGAGFRVVYSASKFVQLLGTHYWRRALPWCQVIAVSPGLIPNTKLAQTMSLSMDMPDAKTIPEGAQNLLRAFTITDIPADPEQIFLTSWGEWWPKDVYAISLDTALQDKWCLSKADIESSNGFNGQ